MNTKTQKSAYVKAHENMDKFFNAEKGLNPTAKQKRIRHTELVRLVNKWDSESEDE